ncbi:hypothetical protein HZI73_22375 [Vallitalea pronyensis]|uniref:Uncharacterized protein n=1 Tax=Vallitalea pronyensis TaxID=1348613 RepID=A0A8J8MPA2_9FIRM|nr:hypothetical protein [Vallitalea pronyensis]QUI24878.1 hypothetical protein HZI73_22375 [Vallitalea pronyensis]
MSKKSSNKSNNNDLEETKNEIVEGAKDSGEEQEHQEETQQETLKKINNIEVEKIAEVNQVIIWRPVRPLTITQHAIVSGILRHEQKESGVKIVLMPFLCEAGE